MRRNQRYYMANGFHGTETYVVVKRGRVPTATMIAADKRLCKQADCKCGMSEASNPTDGQRHGIQGEPELCLVNDGGNCWRLERR